MNIPIAKPSFDEAEKEALSSVLDSGWIVQGPKVKAFEDAFAALCGVKHALATTSCTTALHLALVALGVKAGDEVILPSFTFVATANAVEYCGAKPVFCDIDPRTFNLDLSQVEKKITPKTKALLPVSLFGLGADMPAIEALAERHSLKVLEDAACATGSRIGGRHAGSWKDAGAFSFHPRKIITTGEGGMVTTNDDALAETIRSLRDHGASKSDLERHQSQTVAKLPDYNILGYNYRMTDFQGALGLAQLKKLPLIARKRAAIAQRYSSALKGLDWLTLPYRPEGYEHAFQSFVCTTENRDAVLSALQAAGISGRQGTHAVHRLGFYRKKYGLKAEDFPASSRAEDTTLALPLFADMTDGEIEKIIHFLLEYKP